MNITEFCLLVMAAVIVFESAIIVHDNAVYYKMRRRMQEQRRRMDVAIQEAVEAEMEKRTKERKPDHEWKCDTVEMREITAEGEKQ